MIKNLRFRSDPQIKGESILVATGEYLVTQAKNNYSIRDFNWLPKTNLTRALLEFHDVSDPCDEAVRSDPPEILSSFSE